MKLPAIQWYPADWRKDPGVQSLDLETRMIWFETLMLMHESEERGKLLLNGKPMPSEAHAKVLGLDKQILTTALTRISEYGVSSVDPISGALISRRMVRDEQLRKIRQKAGKLGGNPVLLNQNPTTQVNQNPTPSARARTEVENEDEVPLVDSGESEGVAEKSLAKVAATHDARELILHLNSKAGRSFRPSDANVTAIRARLSEPDVTLDGCTVMIDRQVACWLGTDMEQYLTVETLFRKSKFSKYYDDRNQPVRRAGQDNGRTGSKGFDRNQGTLNAGNADAYDFAKIQAARRASVPDVPGPAANPGD